MFILPFLLVMTVVVLVHEFGHYFVARWCGVTVETFSVGFGRELLGRSDRHGTRWRLGWIPLGAYVKFFDGGDNPPTASDGTPGTAGVQPQPEPFHAKPLWQRAITIAAGPAANILLAIVIYTSLNMFVGVAAFAPRIGSLVPGMPAQTAGLLPGDIIKSIDGNVIHTYDDISRLVGTSDGRSLAVEIQRYGARLTFNVTPIVEKHVVNPALTIKWGDVGIRRPDPAIIGNVPAGLPAAKAGIKSGDLVTKIDGKPISNYDDLVQFVAPRPLEVVNFTIERGGKSIEIPITPILFSQPGPDGRATFRGRIGVGAAAIKVGPVEAMDLAIQETSVNVHDVLGGLWNLFSSHGAADEVGGPIAMAQVTAEVAELGSAPLVRWTALLSVSIGLLNLLPIPVLDGGRLLYYAIEAVRRRPLSRHIQEAGYRIGLAFVLVLLCYANISDLVRLGSH